MPRTVLSALAALLLVGAPAIAAPAPASLYDFKVHRLDGKPVSLKTYRGQVLLIVNTASHCGYTPQYEALEKLNKAYHRRGLRVLGFPSNDFLGQEPGTNAQIQTFCTEKYGVTFDMFEKGVVKGQGQEPLYHFLTSPETDPRFAGPITWNFNKFLVDRHGAIVARFASDVKPDAPALVEAVEAALKKPEHAPASAKPASVKS